MAAEIRLRFPGVLTTVGDCQRRIPYEDGYFDRVIAIHVLEHLPDLPSAIDEVWRVLKPNGLFSIVFPCDPGIAYEIARKISAERVFRARYKLPYRWLIRREHVNSAAEVEHVLRQRFDIFDKTFFPLVLPVVNMNLCIGVTARRRPGLGS